MRSPPTKKRLRAREALPAQLGDGNYGDKPTTGLDGSQDAAAHLQPASVYAARALAQLRGLTDSASRNLWKIEYAIAEAHYWKKGTR